MKVQVLSRYPEVLAKLAAKVERGMEKAGVFLDREIKWSLSVPGPTKTNPDTPASDTGEPPHLRTGTLRANVGFQVVKTGNTMALALGLKDGTGPAGQHPAGDQKTDGYGYLHEYGTDKMPSRPYVRPAVYNNAKKIVQIIAGGSK